MRKPRLEMPSISEREWLGASIAMAMITFCSVVIAAAATLHETFQDRYSVVQLWQPFVTFLVAVTTFTTVVWRGLISARQADTGLKQLDVLGNQMAAAEENNLANLLEKAGALLDTKQPAQQATGLALVRHIGVSKFSPFRAESAALLLSFIEGKTIISLGSQEGIVLEYLREIHSKTKEIYRTKLTLQIVDVEYFLPHLDGVTYVEAVFTGLTFDSRHPGNRYLDCDFERCTFERFILADDDARFVDCKMAGVLRPNRTSLKAGNTTFEYSNCDFSGVKRLAVHANHRFSHCFYYADNLPSERVLKLGGVMLAAKQRPVS